MTQLSVSNLKLTQCLREYDVVDKLMLYNYNHVNKGPVSDSIHTELQ